MARRLKSSAVVALGVLSVVVSAQQAANIRPLFTREERIAVQEYWAESDRYLVRYLPAPWQAVYSSEASIWLFKYYRARSKGAHVVPTITPIAANETEKRWDKWIGDRYELDRARAVEAALQANNDYTDSLNFRRTVAQTDPGPCPEDLVDLVGEPPRFWVVDKPHTYSIKFDDVTITYKDNVTVRPKYAYYRYNIGVNSEGLPVKKVPAPEMAAILAESGLTRTEANVMRAVSPLEGGFDSVNTYDTGFVSVGLIQFASLQKGAGSLGSVLLELKQRDPEAFQRDFRRYGIDVSNDGVLSAVNIYTAEETQGPDANMQIIQDKRLVATMQRAGQMRPFRIAQLRVARKMFYPADDVVSVTLNGTKTKVRVGDVVKSEAGLATLMDLKVNTGGLSNLGKVLTEIASANNVTNGSDLARYEAEIVRRMKYRNDFTKNHDLTQPPAPPSGMVAVNTKKSGRKTR